MVLIPIRPFLISLMYEEKGCRCLLSIHHVDKLESSVDLIQDLLWS